jgi:signal transduction histidine kinase
MKLAAALLVPLVALVAVTLVEAFTISGDVADIKDEAEMAERLLGPSSLVTMLEHERDAAGVYLLGQERSFALPVEDNAQARAELDEALEGFRADLGERSDLAEVYAPAVDALGGIAELRASVDAAADAERTLDNTAAADEVFTGYSEIMEQLFAADRQVARSIEDPDLRRGAELYDLSARQTDAVARLVRDLLLPAAAGEANGLDESGEISAVARVLAEVRANDAQIRLTAQGDYEPLASALYAADHVVRFPSLAESALETGEVDLTEVMAASTGPDPSAEGYTAFRADVSDMLRQQADDVRSAADARRMRYLALAILAIAVAVAIMWAVSRSITGPLRSLTRQAKDMAGRRLPAAVREILETPLGDDVVVPDVVPVAVRTRDEVADVVAALNTVQESALDLAVEQAVLRRNIADSFVNLGRRNQNLLGRQLDFITELESNETDPEVLGSLFRLDHLATRMRRNAESLLVLAGIEPPRKWAAPVRLTDVIRSALGEVEDYQRVALRSVEPATVLGSAAADLAHLIAEFVENALTFSPPDQPVEVFGGPRPEGGYRLSITDAGVGMSDTGLAEANRRLAGAESFTVAPSKYLGHYVAANLAVRHGVTVSLCGRRPGAGVVVTIELPVGLLTEDGETANVPVPVTRPARAGVAGASPLDVHGPDIYAPSASAGPGAEPARTAAGLPMRGPRPRPALPAAEAPAVTASGLPMRRRGGAPADPTPVDTAAPGPTVADADQPATPGLPSGPASAGPSADAARLRTPGGIPSGPVDDGPLTPGDLTIQQPGAAPSAEATAEHRIAPPGATPTDADADRPTAPGGLPIRQPGAAPSAEATEATQPPIPAGPSDGGPTTPGGLPLRRPAAHTDAPPTEPAPATTDPAATGLPDRTPPAPSTERTGANGATDAPHLGAEPAPTAPGPAVAWPADDHSATAWAAPIPPTSDGSEVPIRDPDPAATAEAPAIGWPANDHPGAAPVGDAAGWPADDHPGTAATGGAAAWATPVPPTDRGSDAAERLAATEAAPTAELPTGDAGWATPVPPADGELAPSADVDATEAVPTAQAPAPGWPAQAPPTDDRAGTAPHDATAEWPAAAAPTDRDADHPIDVGCATPVPPAGVEATEAVPTAQAPAAGWATPVPATEEAAAAEATDGGWRLAIPDGGRDHHARPRRTRSGLPVRRPGPNRRPPAPAGSGDAVQARVRAQDDLLVALRGRPVPRPQETTVPAGSGTAPGTNGGLARRVPGAQLPDTHGPRLRRGPSKGGPAQPAPPTTERGGGREQQLHDLLKHLTEGSSRAQHADED